MYTQKARAWAKREIFNNFPEEEKVQRDIFQLLTDYNEVYKRMGDEEERTKKNH